MVVAIERWSHVFATELARARAMKLRGGDALDEYRQAPVYDACLDRVTDAHLERYGAGLSYLDAASWRHYLPSYAEYALRDRARSRLGIDALLNTLRPPDRDPRRLASLSKEQEGLIREMLEVMAFSSDSAYQAEACQGLEEWWIENPLYRNSSGTRDE
jgi:hypothetical protein